MLPLIRLAFSSYRSEFHIFGPDKETAYDLQNKGAVKLNGNQGIRSNKDISDALLNQIAKDSNISIAPFIFLDIFKAHCAAANFIK